MGGGGAMRAVAKVAGVNAVNGGVRGAGFTAVPQSTGQSMIRSASRPVSVSVSQSKLDDVSSAVQRPAWELDDWEFAGAEEEELVAVGFGGGGAAEPMARVVFGSPPSLDEAKDATSDLKEAIDKVLVASSKSYASDGPFEADDVRGASFLSHSVSSEGKIWASPVPKVTMQAFAFLSESPAAQSVVASVASDPNVWNAVMQNEALVEFLQSSKKSYVTLEDAESVNEADESSDENQLVHSGKSGGSFVDFVNDIKLKVVQMVSNVSAFIQDMFGSTSMEPNGDDANGKPKPAFFNDTRTFLALAVMVIMVVVLKRA